MGLECDATPWQGICLSYFEPGSVCSLWQSLRLWGLFLAYQGHSCKNASLQGMFHCSFVSFLFTL